MFKKILIFVIVLFTIVAFTSPVVGKPAEPKGNGWFLSVTGDRIALDPSGDMVTITVTLQAPEQFLPVTVTVTSSDGLEDVILVFDESGTAKAVFKYPVGPCPPEFRTYTATNDKNGLSDSVDVLIGCQ